MTVKKRIKTGTHRAKESLYQKNKRAQNKGVQLTTIREELTVEDLIKRKEEALEKQSSCERSWEDSELNKYLEGMGKCGKNK